MARRKYDDDGKRIVNRCGCGAYLEDGEAERCERCEARHQRIHRALLDPKQRPLLHQPPQQPI